MLYLVQSYVNNETTYKLISFGGVIMSHYYGSTKAFTSFSTLSLLPTSDENNCLLEDNTIYLENPIWLGFVYGKCYIKVDLWVLSYGNATVFDQPCIHKYMEIGHYCDEFGKPLYSLFIVSYTPYNVEEKEDKHNSDARLNKPNESKSKCIDPKKLFTNFHVTPNRGKIASVRETILFVGVDFVLKNHKNAVKRIILGLDMFICGRKMEIMEFVSDLL